MISLKLNCAAYRSTYVVLTVFCFVTFRKTLGNSLYCLPHRTGRFSPGVVRVIHLHSNVHVPQVAVILCLHLLAFPLASLNLSDTLQDCPVHGWLKCQNLH